MVPRSTPGGKILQVGMLLIPLFVYSKPIRRRFQEIINVVLGKNVLSREVEKVDSSSPADVDFVGPLSEFIDQIEDEDLKNDGEIALELIKLKMDEEEYKIALQREGLDFVLKKLMVFYARQHWEKVRQGRSEVGLQPPKIVVDFILAYFDFCKKRDA